MGHKKIKNKEKITSLTLAKALKLLEKISEENMVGVTELARKLKMNKAIVYRFLSTFKQMGFVKQEPHSKKYSLTLKLFELGSKVLSELNLIDEAHPVMQKISEATKETVHLAVMDGEEIVYIDKVDSPQTLRMYSRIGKRAPAYCTGLGKVLLAWSSPSVIDKVSKHLRKFTENTNTDPLILQRELHLVRERGYAVDNEEYEKGICCVAAPIRDINGEVVAALSISGPNFRFNEERIEEYKNLVVASAKEISERMGFYNNVNRVGGKNL